MSDETNIEKIVREFIKYADEEKVEDLEKLFSDNASSLEILYNKKEQNHNVFGDNDWKNHFLGFLIYTKKSNTNDDIHNCQMNAFVELAKKVDKYLENNCQFLKTSSKEEYERNSSLCKDISIPCFHITSSLQSTKKIIEIFFFSIYSAYQILKPYREKEIPEKIPDEDKFAPMFKQEFSIHPVTLNKFFHNDAQNFFPSQDDKQDTGCIKQYIGSIKNSLQSILITFVEFIQNCNDLLFTLMCRWLELFLKSMSLIPPYKLIQKLPDFLGNPDQDQDQDQNLVKNLDEIIKKNSIFKAFSETSVAAYYFMLDIIECFEPYKTILKYSSNRKQREIKKKIQNKIKNLKNLKFIDATDKDDKNFDNYYYNFSPEIKEYILSFSSLEKEETNKKTTKKLKKDVVVKLIEKTFLYFKIKKKSSKGKISSGG